MEWAGHATKFLIIKLGGQREFGRCGMADTMMKFMLKKQNVRG